MRNISLALALLLSASLSEASPCRDLFVPKNEANSNTLIPAENYRFEHTRLLGEYFYFLGEGFYNQTRSLKPGELTLDIGGGLGIAHLQLAMDHGARAVVINKQDFPTHWKNSRQRLEKEGPSSVQISKEHLSGDRFPNMYTIESIAGLSRSDLANVAILTGFELPRFIEKRRTVTEITPERVHSFALEVLLKYDSTLQSANFTYHAELAENVLPAFRDQVSLVTDVFGAFFYSSGRKNLLEQIDQALRQDGKAFISVVGFFQRNIHDTVLLRDGTEVSLIEYLTLRHPRNFRLEGTTDDVFRAPPVLIFTKTSEPLRLKLQKIVDLQSYSENGMVVPRVSYKEIP